MNRRYDMNGLKDNEVISTTWYIVPKSLPDFDFRWGGRRKQNEGVEGMESL